MNLLDPGEPLSVERGVEEHQLSTRSRECCFVSAMHQNNFLHALSDLADAHVLHPRLRASGCCRCAPGN